MLVAAGTNCDFDYVVCVRVCVCLPGGALVLKSRVSFLGAATSMKRMSSMAMHREKMRTGSTVELMNEKRKSVALVTSVEGIVLYQLIHIY